MWIFGVLIAVVAYIFIEKWHIRLLYSKLECGPVHFVNSDGYFGFKLVYQLVAKKGFHKMVFLLREALDNTNGTVESTVAGTTAIYTRDPENFKAVFATQFDDYILKHRYKAFEPFLGYSVFTMDGEPWKQLWALLRPQFTKEQVGHVKALEPHMKLLISQIRETKGEPFEAFAYFIKFTQDTASEFLFGQSFNSQKDGMEGGMPAEFIQNRRKFNELVFTAMKFSSVRSILRGWMWAIKPKSFTDACDTIREFTDIHVNRALSYSDKELEKLTASQYTILYELAKATKDPKVIRCQLLSMLIAGKDTTMSTLSFLWYEVSRNPVVFAKLREEIANTFGVGENAEIENITFESLKKCTYLKAVINEVMRLWPVVPTNSRLAARDTTLPRGGGEDGSRPILVRKDTEVILLVFALQRDPEIFGADAEVFRPERWLETNTKPAWSFVPFGGGPRVCLGQQFALTEVSYVTTRLLQEFSEVKNLDTQYPPQVVAHMGMHLQDHCIISMK